MPGIGIVWFIGEKAPQRIDGIGMATLAEGYIGGRSQVRNHIAVATLLFFALFSRDPLAQPVGLIDTRTVIIKNRLIEIALLFANAPQDVECVAMATVLR